MSTNCGKGIENQWYAVVENNDVEKCGHFQTKESQEKKKKSARGGCFKNDYYNILIKKLCQCGKMQKLIIILSLTNNNCNQIYFRYIAIFVHVYMHTYIHPRLDPWVRKIPWRRAWQPTSIFLSGEFHAQRNLVGYSPWDHKE